jgi:hypothetical protein
MKQTYFILYIGDIFKTKLLAKSRSHVGNKYDILQHICIWNKSIVGGMVLGTVGL